MILSHKHKVVYIHVPRTGGSWLSYKILHYEDNYFGSGREMYSINGKKLNLGRHTKLQNLYEQQDIIGVDLNTYYKFLTVRHPYTRFMSAWLYFTQYQKTAERHNLKKVEDMMDWIEDGANKIHILPQVNWHDERFDDVIKFESIQKLNLRKHIPAWDKKTDTVKKSGYGWTLSKELKQRIYKFYKEDFETFNYDPTL